VATTGKTPGLGDIEVPTLDVTPADTDTSASVVITGPGVTITPGVTGGPLTPVEGEDYYTQTWVADPFEYSVPGEWVQRWTVDGTGGGAEEIKVTIERPFEARDPITVDPSTDIGLVRLLCTDLDESAPLFLDTQIDAFLTAEGGTIKLAAALALETIATSEALVSKKMTTSEGITTDGPAVAKSLLDRAAQLRAQAAAELAVTVEADDGYGLDIVDFDPRSWWTAPI